MTPGQLAQVACLLEASARKAGNVHRFRDFDDCHYLDYALSAQAIGAGLDLARTRGVGVAVLSAIEATRQVVATNTNLGMVLLLAPMAAVREGEPLREGVADVLRDLTCEDAGLVYQAIRLANPGGLGTVDKQDVHSDPTVTLTEAMALASDRDLVARQYANDYADVFELALPAIEAAIAEGRTVETAIVSAHLRTLAWLPDTLIVRKCGINVAQNVMDRAREVLLNGWPESVEGVEAFNEFDAWLREDCHARNPGATADLVAAALFAALRDGTINMPIAPWSSSA